MCAQPCSSLPARHLSQQSGSSAAVEAKKRELEAKRAAQASRGEKIFYKVTVRVR